MELGSRKLVHTAKSNSTEEMPSNCIKILERATRGHREMDHKQLTVAQGLAWKVARSNNTMEVKEALISSKTSTLVYLAERNSTFPIWIWRPNRVMLRQLLENQQSSLHQMKTTYTNLYMKVVKTMKWKETKTMR